MGSPTALVADRALDQARDRDLARVRRREVSLCQSLDPAFAYDRISKLDIELDLAIGLALELNQDLDDYVDVAVAHALARALERAEIAAVRIAPKMLPELRDLRVKLPEAIHELDAQWRQRFQTVTIQHRDIGHGWRLSPPELARTTSRLL